MRDLGKHDVLGVLIDAVDREAALKRIVHAANERRPYKVTALAVHGVMTGTRDREHRARLNGFDLAVPDGQPVRWALNQLHRTGLTTAVRGTDLTVDLLAAAEREQLPVFFYGSTTQTLQGLCASVRRRFPEIQIAGSQPSRFRRVDETDQEVIASLIRRSNARLVFVGLGCPRQEVFVYAMGDKVGVPMIAVGAAFDYLAGTLRAPPPMIHRWGLEWLWRLVLEPRRLWRRYLVLNPAYLGLLALELVGVYRPEPVTGMNSPIPELEA